MGCRYGYLPSYIHNKLITGNKHRHSSPCSLTCLLPIPCHHHPTCDPPHEQLLLRLGVGSVPSSWSPLVVVVVPPLVVVSPPSSSVFCCSPPSLSFPIPIIPPSHHCPPLSLLSPPLIIIPPLFVIPPLVIVPPLIVWSHYHHCCHPILIIISPSLSFSCPCCTGPVMSLFWSHPVVVIGGGPALLLWYHHHPVIFCCHCL